jgi:hypothetical protein
VASCSSRLAPNSHPRGARVGRTGIAPKGACLGWPTWRVDLNRPVGPRRVAPRLVELLGAVRALRVGEHASVLTIAAVIDPNSSPVGSAGTTPAKLDSHLNGSPGKAVANSSGYRAVDVRAIGARTVRICVIRPPTVAVGPTGRLRAIRRARRVGLGFAHHAGRRGHQSKECSDQESVSAA